jgi:basic amino acid/polyamine antiporter, APA family
METLKRALGVRDLVLLVIGCVVGSGIFLVPGAVLRESGGDVGVALFVWLVAGLLSLLGALTYGELGAMRPEAGGLYVYIRDAFGRLPAFLQGWTLFFVLSSGAVAALAVAFSSYLGQLVPLGPVTAKLVSVSMIAAVAAINVAGTRKSASVQNWTTSLKAGAVVIMSLVLLALGQHPALGGHLWPARVSLSLLSGVGIAMIAVLWAYEGWQYVTFSVGETRDPQSTFPRGIAIGTAATIVIYVLANVAYFVALGPAAAATSSTIAADAVSAVVGVGASKVIAAVILTSIFSAANGFTLTSTRVYFAMASDGLFFRSVATIHPRFKTPVRAIILSSIWTAVLALSGTFEQLLTYVVYVGWIFYGLGALTIFYYRSRHPDAPRPFRVPWYPVTPALFVIAAAAIVLNTTVSQPWQALVGVAVVLTGLPAFYVWEARARRVAGAARSTGPK